MKKIMQVLLVVIASIVVMSAMANTTVVMNKSSGQTWVKGNMGAAMLVLTSNNATTVQMTELNMLVDGYVLSQRNSSNNASGYYVMTMITNLQAPSNEQWRTSSNSFLSMLTGMTQKICKGPIMVWKKPLQDVNTRMMMYYYATSPAQMSDEVMTQWQNSNDKVAEMRYSWIENIAVS